MDPIIQQSTESVLRMIEAQAAARQQPAPAQVQKADPGQEPDAANELLDMIDATRRAWQVGSDPGVAVVQLADGREIPVADVAPAGDRAAVLLPDQYFTFWNGPKLDLITIRLDDVAGIRMISSSADSMMAVRVYPAKENPTPAAPPPPVVQKADPQPINVNVTIPPDAIKVDVAPAQVAVVLPPRETTTTVERDKQGRIVTTRTTEQDAATP